jgi:predicted glycoside hydrolase/deacetylase ChbG (UPF0249 family)
MGQMQTGQTNRLLGYPADARLLIINADDFGMCHSTTVAIFRSLIEGVVSSTTLMVPCSWAPQAMRLLSEPPQRSFGVHLTVIGDNRDYRWRPLSARDDVSSLVDETGYFYSSDRVDEFFAKAKLDEVELEFRAQIDTVLDANLKPTHLDWHALRIHRRPELFDVMFKLAREYGLALRVRTPSLIEKVQQQGLPCNDYDFLDSYELGSTGKAERFIQLLRDLPAGLSEWAVHPGFANQELLAIEAEGAPVRQADFDSMLSTDVRDVIQQEGIILLDYQPLQQVWQNKG